MNVYVLDANIVSFYLKENDSVINHITRSLSAGEEILIAPIAYYEVRRGLLAIGSTRRMNEFDRLCEMLTVGRLDNDILDIAADIYNDLRKIGRITDDADIFIAAFCKHHDFILVTNNTKHFENIAGLNIVDWTIEQ